MAEPANPEDVGFDFSGLKLEATPGMVNQPISARIIDPEGDVVIQVKFVTGRKTKLTGLRLKPENAQSRTEPQDWANFTVAWRVKREVMEKTSDYFSGMLGNTRFIEGAKLAKLFGDLRNAHDQPASELPTVHLPRANITDEDDSSLAYAGREYVFEDMLRLLHGLDPDHMPPSQSFQYGLVLSVLCDRFLCTNTVSANFKPKVSFPVVSVWQPKAELLLRQQVLVAW